MTTTGRRDVLVSVSASCGSPVAIAWRRALAAEVQAASLAGRASTRARAQARGSRAVGSDVAWRWRVSTSRTFRRLIYRSTIRPFGTSSQPFTTGCS
eukprot:2142215-Prymnesium_polylepis.1